MGKGEGSRSAEVGAAGAMEEMGEGALKRGMLTWERGVLGFVRTRSGSGRSIHGDTSAWGGGG